MSPIVVLVLSFLVMPVGIYFIYRGCRQKYDYAPLKVMLKNTCFTSGAISFLVGLIGISAVLFFSVIVDLTGNDLTLILDNGGNVIDVPQQSRWVWHNKVVVLKRETHMSASIQPITDNPKVRHLGLTVDTEIVDARRFAESMGVSINSRCEDINDTGLVCKQRDAGLFHLYEFMNAHSRELSWFYNPYDPQQTRDLEALLHANLDESLAAKGLRLVKLAKWTTE